MDTNGNSKELLIKDLCSRLPYGVKCYAYQYKIDGNDCECYGILTGINNGYFYLSDRVPINGGKTYDERYLEVRPYLRPLSSMTEEESNELGELITIYDIVDWMLAHHFDCRIDPSTGKTLIESNLAIEAPEDMYKNE